jgi:copper(I)-binding protein
MATGILGTPADLAAATNTTVYTVPAETFSVVTVNVVNRNSQSRNVRIALASTDTPTDAEFVEYDAELIANGVLEKSGIVLNAGKKVVVYSDSTGVSAMVYGIETPTS